MLDERKLTFDRCRGLLESFLARLEEGLGTNLLAVALYGSVARSQGGRRAIWTC